MQVAVSVPETEESLAATPSASCHAASDILVPATIESAGIADRADVASSSPPPTVVQGSSEAVACMLTQLQLRPSERQRLCFDEPVRQPDMRSPLPPSSVTAEVNSLAAVELPVQTDATTDETAGDSDSKLATEDAIGFEEAFGDKPLLPSSPLLAVKDIVSQSQVPAADGDSASPPATAASTLHRSKQAGCGVQSCTDAAASQAASGETHISKPSETVSSLDVPIKALLPQDELPLSRVGDVAVSSSSVATNPDPHLPDSPPQSLSKPSATEPAAQDSDLSNHLDDVASGTEGPRASSGAAPATIAEPASVVLPKTGQTQNIWPEPVDSCVQPKFNAASSRVHTPSPHSSVEVQPSREDDILVSSAQPPANDLGAPAETAAATPLSVPVVAAQEFPSEIQEGGESEGHESVSRTSSPPVPAVAARLRRLSLTPAGKFDVIQPPADVERTSSPPVPAVAARLRRLSGASTVVTEGGVSPASSLKQLVVDEELHLVGKHMERSCSQAEESAEAPAPDSPPTSLPSSVGRQEVEYGGGDLSTRPSFTAALPSSPPVPAVAAAMRRANSTSGSQTPEETARRQEAALLPPLPSPAPQSTYAPLRVSRLPFHLGLDQMSRLVAYKKAYIAHGCLWWPAHSAIR